MLNEAQKSFKRYKEDLEKENKSVVSTADLRTKSKKRPADALIEENESLDVIDEFW